MRVGSAIDRPETFYNPENDTIYLVPAFVALVASDAEPTLSEEHQDFRWQSPQDAASSVEWAAMRDSILLVGEAFANPERPSLGVTEFDPESLR